MSKKKESSSIVPNILIRIINYELMDKKENSLISIKKFFWIYTLTPSSPHPITTPFTHIYTMCEKYISKLYS